MSEAEIAHLRLEVQQRDAIIASLRASLDDAYREVARLAAEKTARDKLIRAAREVLRPHKQEASA